METYWGRIRQLSASSPFCCHYPQAPPCLMAGQPARNRARPKSKGGSFQFRPSSHVPKPPPHHPSPLTPHPSTIHAYNLDASETRDPCLLPHCISYTRQGFGSRTRDSASRDHMPTPTSLHPHPHLPSLPYYYYYTTLTNLLIRVHTF